MTGTELAAAILLFAVAGLLLFFAIRHFRERGRLLNNAYLYASKEERETMDKKPHYRQSAIVFCFLSGVFLVLGLAIVLQNDKIELLEIPLMAGAVIYAVVSSARIKKRGE